jgi:gliding motility-associated-like protein
MNHIFSLLAFFLLGLVFTSNAQCGACQQEVDVIQNGNFSNGNSGFSTEMTPGTGFFCPLCPEGTYAVGSFAFLYHSDFVGQDHTNPPAGQFLIANGTAEEGIEVWCQNVNILPQTDYTFRYWARDVTNNSNPHPLAVLHVSINGVLVGDSLVAEGGWQENVITWNSGELTTAQICIVNYQSNPGGNDFGLDDISMTACHPVVLDHAADAGIDLEVCSGESLQLGPVPHAGYNYLWAGDGALQNSNSGQPTFQSPSGIEVPTTYSFTMVLDSANLGCITQDEMIITVLPSPTLSLAGPIQICEGAEATLSCSGIFDTILWSVGSNEQSIIADASGTYEATAYLGNCSISASWVLEMIEMPEIDLGDDIQACESSLPVVLSTEESVWWNNQVNANVFSISSSGQYIASYEESNCAVSDTILVAIDVMPVSTLQEEYVLCTGSSIAISSGQAGLWNTGVFSNEIEVDDAGLYSVEISNGSCQLQSSTVVIEKSIPTPTLDSEVSICEGEDYYLDPGDFQDATYLWNDGETNQIYRANQAGVYEVEVTNICGTASAAATVSLELCNWGIFIPNAFSQNGDGVNDEWLVKGYNITNLKVYVYNRFGDMIFFTEALESPWTPDSMLVGQDAYTYRVEALNYNGEKIERHGHIRLLR